MDMKDLEQLPSVGKGTSQKMKDGGITSIMSVAVATPGQITDACGITATSARKIIQAARELCELGFEMADKVEEKENSLQKISSHCETIDKLLGGGLELKTSFEAFGEFACLTGDTTIYINRNYGGRKYRLDYLYKQFNKIKTKYTKQWDLNSDTFVRSFDGDIIRLHKINNVVYSGEKKVWELKLKDGKKIKATNDHKILTNNGWKELLTLDIKKDLVMCDNPKPKGDNSCKVRRTYNFIISKPKFHPFINGNGNAKGQRSLEIHRAIFEAYMNDLELEKYLDIIFKDEEKSKTLKYIDPNKYHIHHIDFNHHNNDITNLICLPKIEHLKLHGKMFYKNFGQGIPNFIEIESIEYVGIEKTYDVVCDEPHHNFVANGMVVHNSGKTNLGHLFAVSSIKQFPDSYVIWIDTENTFKPSRIRNFCKGLEMDPEYVLKHIKVGKAVTSDHQILLTENIEQEINNGLDIKLIIVDSIMNHFRAEYLGRGTLSVRQQMLNGYLHKLKKLTDMYDVAVYATNQVMANPGQLFGDPTAAIGGHIVGHFATTRVYIRKAAKGTRKMVMVDSPSLPMGEAMFKIEETKLEGQEEKV